MTSAMVMRVVAFAVVALGIMLGGPQRLPAGTAVVGAAPVQEDCNGNGKESGNCINIVGYSNCKSSIPGTFENIKSEQPGTNLGNRYNNDVMVCTTNTESACKRYTLKIVDPKTCKDVLSSTQQ